MLSKSVNLESVDAKLHRATEQLQAISDHISEWNSLKPLKLSAHLSANRRGLVFIFEEFIFTPDFLRWGVIFGECIHNIRSSLDNLAFALALSHKNPPTNSRTISFPIFQDADTFEQRGRGNISQLPPEAASLIEKLQPFNRHAANGLPTNNLLHILHQMNNDDKHRVPQLVLLRPATINYEGNILLADDFPQHGEIQILLDGGILVPGRVVAEIVAPAKIKSSEGELKGEYTVAFSGQEIAAVSLIDAMITEVNAVVNQFRGYFK